MTKIHNAITTHAKFYNENNHFRTYGPNKEGKFVDEYPDAPLVPCTLYQDGQSVLLRFTKNPLENADYQAASTRLQSVAKNSWLEKALANSDEKTVETIVILEGLFPSFAKKLVENNADNLDMDKSERIVHVSVAATSDNNLYFYPRGKDEYNRWTSKIISF